MNNELKAYSFQNFYLNGKQAGIQTAHSLASLSLIHSDEPFVQKWALVDKTIVILHGGDSDALAELLERCVRTKDMVESHGVERLITFGSSTEPGLGDALVNVSIVLSDTAHEMLEKLKASKNQAFIIKQSNSISHGARPYSVFTRKLSKTTRPEPRPWYDYTEVISGVSYEEAHILIQIATGRTLK